LLHIQAGSSIARIGDRCHIHILETGDHVFSMKATRVALEKVLDQELFARNTWKEIPAASKELGRSA
jgi:hypothetical protein